MPTIKKPSKSMAFQNEKSNDLEQAKKALANGAKIVKDNKGGHAIEYPTGGYFKITKTVYNKMAIKKLKYKVGQMVYSYQNPTVKYPITWIRESKVKGYAHAYKLSLKNGYSNWIDEKGIYLTKKKK